MSRAAAFVMALGAVMGSALAEAASPVVRVAVSPQKTVLVGQQVTVTVQILVPNYFLSAPDWPTLDIDGTIVTVPDEALPHLTETIGSESYAGVQHSYVVVPQQEGQFVLPPLEIHFKYAAVPGQPPADGVVRLPPSRFSASLPEGARTDEGVLPVTRVTVKQSLSRAPTGLKAGDALTRTITSVVAHAQPMLILPPAIDAPEGVRLYRKDPVLSTDVGVRGELNAGTRVDRVTYLFEKPGDFTLPAVEFPWFDAASGTRHVATAPAVVVHVGAAPAAAHGIAPEPPPAPAPAPPPSPWTRWRARLPGVAASLAGFFVGAWLVRRVWPRYRAWSAARRHERETSEPAYFDRFERSCAAGNPSEAYAALARWAWRGGQSSIAGWCSTLEHEGFTTEVASLERTLFAAAESGPWSGGALRRTAIDARARWRSAASDRRRHRSWLPVLNP